MNTYITLDAAHKYLTLASQSTEDDELIKSLMFNASRSVDHFTRRKFYPRLETRFYDFRDSKQLKVDDDLLSVYALKTQNGACTIASGVMWLAAGDSWNHTPYDRVILQDTSGSQLYYSNNPQRSQELTAFWGYHENYSEAWVDTGTSLANNYAASAGTISLAGAGSAGTGSSDVQGVSPRISVGDLLKMGDQLFYVIGGDTSGNASVVVTPYVNGTHTASVVTGGSYPSGTSIAKFAPEPDIVWATKRLTAWMYGQKDSPFFQKQAAFQFGLLEIAEQWPVDVKERLTRFVRRTIQIYPSN